MNPVVKRPLYYADANLKKPVDYHDYENFKYETGSEDYYEVTKKIGRGKYSEVFEGANVINNKKCVIKVLKPVRKKKIKREILILQNLAGGPNIINMYDVTKNEERKTVSLVFEYVDNIEFRTLYPTLSDFDIRYYTYQILKGLDFAHSNGIMHRDIKPHNIMIDHEKKYLKIIDWGLAEFYFPNKDYNVRVASRFYKGPELLVDYQYYDYSLDVWSLGCMFAGMIFKIETFFQGSDNYDQLEKISRVLGSDELFDYVERYHVELDRKFENVLGNHSKKSFNKFVNAENAKLANQDALNLVSEMLIYDHAKRTLPRDLMNNPYFIPVKQEEEKLEKLKKELSPSEFKKIGVFDFGEKK